MNSNVESRREFIRKLTSVFGVAVFAGIPDPAAAQGSKEVEAEGYEEEPAVIVRGGSGQLQVRLDVSGEQYLVPPKDYPPGWNFRSGDRVIATHWPREGRAVRPFVVVSPGSQPLLEGKQVHFGDITAEVSNQVVRRAIEEAIRDGRRRHGLLVYNETDHSLRAFGITLAA